MSWKEGLDVTASLMLDSVNPAPFVEGLEGDLSGEAEVAFHQGDDGWELDVPLLDISGTLDDRQLSLTGRLSGNSAMQWDIHDLDFLRATITSASPVGSASHNLDIDGQLKLPDLAALYPGLTGSLNGEIAASGSLQSPQLELSLEGSGTGFQDNRVGQLQLTARVAGIEDPELDVRLDASEIEAGGQQFKRLDLDLSGRLSSHRLELQVDGSEEGPLESLQLALDGALNAARDRYRGSLSPLQVVVPQGSITLDQPLVFNANLNQPSVTAEPFCLRREQGGNICVTEPVSASPEQGKVALSINELPMDLVNQSLPEGWSIEGDSQAELTASWSAGASRLAGHGRSRQRLSVTGVDAYGKAWSVPATSLSVQLDASEARINADLALSLADSGDLSLELVVDDPLGSGRSAVSCVSMTFVWRPIARWRLDSTNSRVPSMATSTLRNPHRSRSERQYQLDRTECEGRGYPGGDHRRQPRYSPHRR